MLNRLIFFLLLFFASGIYLKAQNVIAENGMVVSAHGLASKAGVEILKSGGNAIDAAVTTAFCLAVVEPNASGLGGGGYLVLKLANENELICLDFRETAPGECTDDIFYNNEEKFSIITRFGGKSAGIPGMVAGLLDIHQKYGKLPLSRVMKQAIHYAREGFEISANLSAIILDKYDILSRYPETATIYLMDLLPPPPGTILKNLQLAKSLELIVQNGSKEFYEGSIAHLLIKTVENENGLITLTDLKNYKPEYRKPVIGTYRDYQVISSSPSSGGGTNVIQLLNILEGYNLKKMGHNSAEYIHILAEAMKMVLKDKDKYMGDPAFGDVPVAKLIDKTYAQSLRKFISAHEARYDYYPDLQLRDEAGSTTHLSVADKDRNIVALTQSINFWFSSGIIVKGTGILLNNHMADFADKPGFANSIEPNKRPVSNMAPTILLKDGKPFLTIGTPGGLRIVGALVQIIINIIDFNMGLDAAIEAPRMHAYGKYLDLEGRIAQTVIKELEKMGHTIVMKNKYDAYFGGAQGIIINDISGILYGGADSRRDGVAVGY
jgi:gamma-glutamyltranspeptidase/glutathione hydrolase